MKGIIKGDIKPVENILDPSRSSKSQNLNKESGIVKRILKGLINQNLNSASNKKSKGKFYDIWSVDVDQSRYLRRKEYLPPPKFFEPGHCESYNPPDEYLLSESQVILKSRI